MPTSTTVRMSAISGRASASVTVSMCFFRCRHRARKRDQPLGTAGLAQDFQRALELMRAGGGARIVERHREVGFRGEPKPPFHQRPRLQIVAEVDRAKIMAERRAGAGGGGQHRGDAGQHANVERVQRRCFLQRFEHG